MKPTVLIQTALLWSVCLAFVPAAGAQVTVVPDTLRLSLPTGEQAETVLTVTNEGTAALALSAVPLPAEEAPGTPGEPLFATDHGAVESSQDLAETGDGHILTFGRFVFGSGEVLELTPELEVVRTFEYTMHLPGAYAQGLAWMPPKDAPPGHEQGTLWWLETVSMEYQPPPECSIGLEEAALIETDFDGVATGRTVSLPIPPTPPGGEGVLCTDLLSRLSYDAETGLFYYAGLIDRHAVALDGTGGEGYPVRALSGYPSEAPTWLGGFDASGGMFDLGVGLGQAPVWRVAITYRDGVSTGAETPLAAVGPPEFPRITNVLGVQRSRLDPSVLYVGAQGGGNWIYAVRAHPLPPPWLRLVPLALDVAPEQTDTLSVRLDASGLEPGLYEGAVALREDGPNGETLARVPVVLTVTPGTSAEPSAGPAEAVLRLEAPYPNPSRGATTVSLVLREAADVRLAVYDVLGREVALLREGWLEAGAHRLDFDGSALPAGLYLVRAEVRPGAGGSAAAVTQRLVLTR